MHPSWGGGGDLALFPTCRPYLHTLRQQVPRRSLPSPVTSRVPGGAAGCVRGR